eukprot:869034-Prymnesium_polylepis.1
MLLLLACSCLLGGLLLFLPGSFSFCARLLSPAARRSSSSIRACAVASCSSFRSSSPSPDLGLCHLRHQTRLWSQRLRTARRRQRRPPGRRRRGSRRRPRRHA